MKISETQLAGAFVIEPERHPDSRGFFARTWCLEQFREHGLNTDLVQCNVSFNHRLGTLRGMHWQAAPHQEVKLVRCTRGAVYDVIIDLRPESQTFKRWFGVRLDEDNRTLLYIPHGFAHGFITLADGSEVFYQMSEGYHPESARGVRWDDPAFHIRWPEAVRVIAERDAGYPDFDPVMLDAGGG